MSWIIKLGERYIAPPKTDYWNSAWTSWTTDVNEARRFKSQEVVSVVRRIEGFGCIEIFSEKSAPLD